MVSCEEALKNTQADVPKGHVCLYVNQDAHEKQMSGSQLVTVLVVKSACPNGDCQQQADTEHVSLSRVFNLFLRLSFQVNCIVHATLVI